MGLRDIGESLPPGFRFYPSDDELVCHYLYNKVVCNITSEDHVVRPTLVDIDLHVCEPWQLPDVAKLNSKEWYFFSFHDRKYATGFRANRATATGYWKATGKDRDVLDPMTRAIVGMRKTLVFYKNRAPNGIKTEWIMHEFRLENPHVPPTEDWVVCRVFHKSRSENSNKMITSPYKYNDHPMLPSCVHRSNIIMTSFDHSPSSNEGREPINSLGHELGPIQPSDHDTNEPHHHHMSSLPNNERATKSTCEDELRFLFDLDVPSDMGVPSRYGI